MEHALDHADLARKKTPGKHRRTFMAVAFGVACLLGTGPALADFGNATGPDTTIADSAAKGDICVVLC